MGVGVDNCLTCWACCCNKLDAPEGLCKPKLAAAAAAAWAWSRTEIERTLLPRTESVYTPARISLRLAVDVVLTVSFVCKMRTWASFSARDVSSVLTRFSRSEHLR